MKVRINTANPLQRADVAHSILVFLPLLETFSLACVCKSWRRASKSALKSHNQNLWCYHDTVLVVAPRGSNPDTDAITLSEIPSSRLPDVINRIHLMEFMFDFDYSARFLKSQLFKSLRKLMFTGDTILQQKHVEFIQGLMDSKVELSLSREHYENMESRICFSKITSLSGVEFYTHERFPNLKSLRVRGMSTAQWLNLPVLHHGIKHLQIAIGMDILALQDYEIVFRNMQYVETLDIFCTIDLVDIDRLVPIIHDQLLCLEKLKVVLLHGQNSMKAKYRQMVPSGIKLIFNKENVE